MRSNMTEWSHDRIERLVELYRNRPELWNPQDNNYHVKNVKIEAWTSIAADIGSTVETVKAKVSSLLSSYRREVAKVKKSIAAGNGIIYKSNWFAYKFFSFMTDRYKDLNLEFPDNGCFKFYNNMEDDNTDDSMSFEPSASDMVKVEFHSEEQQPQRKLHLQPVPQPLPNKRKKPDDDPTYVPCVQPHRDEAAMYCEYLACKLRKFDERDKILLMQQINNLMFEAEMRRLGVRDELQDEIEDGSKQQFEGAEFEATGCETPQVLMT